MQNLILITVVIVFAAQISCTKKPNLSGDGAKVSYAIGQGVGQNLKNQGVQLDPEVVGYAVTQTLKGEKADIPPEELKKAVEGLQKAMRETASAEAEKNKGVAAEFLAKNKTKDGVKTTSSGLQYQVIQEGTGKKPTLADTVTAHYTGTLANGTKFDSSLDGGKPLEFPLKAVIKGWQEGLQLMQEGGKYRFVIPPELAYGPAGKPPVIPANSVLVFDVELIKVGKK